jgi:hypothetical protein
MKTLSRDCNEFYHQTFLLLYFSANINKNISLIYTKGIATKKKLEKCDNGNFYQLFYQ